MDYEVPFDIIDTILDDLTYRCDWQSIRSLCRTCKNLVEPCQRRLFSTVAIHRTTLTQLHSLLAKRPPLAVYILHLHYYIDEQSDPHCYITLLQHFSQLHSLHLTGDDTNGGTSWSDMPVDLQTQLIRILRSPSLHSLSLTRIFAWPISLFGNCCNLRQLEIGALGVDDTNLTTFVSSPFPAACQLRRLSIGASAFYALDHMLTARWPNGSRIVDLSLVTVLQDHSIHSPIEKLTSICGSRIEILYFACTLIFFIYELVFIDFRFGSFSEAGRVKQIEGPTCDNWKCALE